MNRDEAKHLSDILKAYGEGKTIEYRKKDAIIDPWMEYIGQSIYDNYYEYRVKPEPKLRPYNSIEEFIKSKNKHGEVLIKPNTSTGYIPVKVNYDYVGIININNDGSCEGEYVSFSRLLKDNWTWQDGSKCGVIEE